MATALSYRNKGSDSSGSDSEDSDNECLNWKRVTKNDGEDLEKIPIAPPPVEPQPTQITNSYKRKRNTIWCEVLEDQMMSETLKFCGIKNKPKGFGSRGEESYDFTVGKNIYNDDGSDENMSDDSRTSFQNRRKRFKSDNYVEVDAAEKEAAKKILKVLGEPKKYLIFRVVKYIGIEKAMKFLKMTEDIEESGGLMIKNQGRRRTPGGVYLFLLRSDDSIGKDIKDKIFEGELNSYERKKKFDDKRKKKSQKHKRNKKKSKGKMEVQTSSPDNSKESDVGHMEEDNIVGDFPDVNVPDTVVKTTSNAIANDSSGAVVNEITSDLEEGEVE
ncbi:phosphorylated adapter RNA export protein isoform X2 [Parasteatoda tepidariorum]|nr:phosphorylated adapter RNA export protein isoform X2 [Parasteatoda tepidariorum]XP_015905180.1 phosphorylated adapter RNA export protein isoform X2 [Parasteatoda tepidariorum]XP_015905182.1 phosphorylated adapter RNA export protein isoform X2 [Parasteatoda tepidariorum]XP_015905183.1 phosphorylated adapter RNA export protein isoform X2 [Parasteatoda tepidariorum]